MKFNVNVRNLKFLNLMGFFNLLYLLYLNNNLVFGVDYNILLLNVGYN